MTTLSARHLEFYQNNGFVRLPQALSPALLKRLRQLSERLEAKAKSDFAAGNVQNQYCLATDSGEPRLFRYNDVLFDAPELALELLSSPAILDICEKLCGAGCVPLQLDLVYKYPHPHPHIAWHQDAPHSRDYPYLNVGVYLDDADENDGCLRYLPNSQHELVDIYQLSNQHGWNIPGCVQQPAQAGDIVVQDVMILHCSEPKRSPGPRRTMYIELRPIAGINQCGKQTAPWAALRKEWMAHVLQAAAPEDIPSGWQQLYGEPSADLASLVESIKQRVEPPIPAVWAPRPVEHPDYPTPSDLRWASKCL